MKRILIAFSVILFVGCTESAPRSDAKSKSILPIANGSNQSELVVLGKYDISGGWLTVYRFGNDTLYVAEGQSDNYPVSVSVK